MTTHIGIGFSRDIDVEKAAETATLLSKSNLGTNKIDLAVILSTIHYNPQKTLSTIYKNFNKARMIGCSTAGIILSDSIETRGIAVLTISSDDMKFGIGSVSHIDDQDMRQAGTILAKNSIIDFGKHGRQVFIFFADGLSKNNSLLLKGIQEVLGNVFPIVGAGSCDDFNFTQTFQIFRDRILNNSATGLILGGPMHVVGVGSRHGWRPLGKPRTVDQVTGHVIRTIDGQRAAALYESYFGQEAENLRSDRLGQLAILYPLGIYIEESNEYLLRNAVDILPDGSIVCQGEVPEGSRVHIMIGNKDSCQQAALEAAQEAHKNLLGKQAKLIIIIESIARLKLLGRTALKEIEKIKKFFDPTVPIIGMYANGEICPFRSSEGVKKPHLQNESIVILAIT